MAYTTINKSSLHFNSKLFTGNGSNGNAQTGVGFQPDMVWLKNRDAGTAHVLVDAVRGQNKVTMPNSASAETTTNADKDFRSFDSDGFTVDTNENFGSTNTNGNNIVAWCWKANGAGSANTDGTIGSHTVSANTTAGFSIVTWTGTGDVRTIGHGLGAIPHFIMIKNRSSGDSWSVGSHKLGDEDWTDKLYLESSGAVSDDNTTWNDTAPTSSVFTVGSSGNVNRNNDVYMAYCFSEKVGYSKFGSYIGNDDNGYGTFVYTGFKPAFLLIKNSSDSGEMWEMFDNKRIGYNPKNNRFYANASDAEDTSAERLDLLSNGFKLRTNGSHINEGGDKMIYMAFAEAPLVGSNNIPCTAR